MDYKRTARSSTLAPAILGGLTSVGLLYPARLEPTRYVGSYAADLDVIGRDMWRAVKMYRDGKTKEEKAAESI